MSSTAAKAASAVEANSSGGFSMPDDDWPDYEDSFEDDSTDMADSGEDE